MGKIQKIIDLKNEEAYVEEYVSLRNHYCPLLLTSPVNVGETKEWLKRQDIEVRGILQDSCLIGVAILYLHREGEIAFFAKHPNQGVGKKLLRIIEQVAKEKSLKSVWAWVLNDNLTAKRTFEKNGYTMLGQSQRFYEGESKLGIQFRKKIC